MTVIGITGPSGAGKGTASEILRTKYGFSVIDADEIYHSLVSGPSPCLDEIRQHFGDSVIRRDGSLDRKKLREHVFGEQNCDKLLMLNLITHKHVVFEIKNLINTYGDTASVCLIDAPLLIEAGLSSLCDLTISITADKDIRAGRIAMRDSITNEEAALRISSQKEDDYYISNTSYNIQNNEGPDKLADLLFKILSKEGVLN